jgi:hypothetical protein
VHRYLHGFMNIFLFFKPIRDQFIYFIEAQMAVAAHALLNLFAQSLTALFTQLICFTRKLEKTQTLNNHHILLVWIHFTYQDLFVGYLTTLFQPLVCVAINRYDC